jgi:nicotinamide-nucleotide amidase
VSGAAAGGGVLEGTAARVLRLLESRGATLAVAESLTGGLVAAELTGVPGASRTFRGSVTAYATELKRDVLGVDGALLAERGAVDPEVARGMAEGVRRALGADWGLGTTGVAGPDPQDGKPVGTVYAAVAFPGGTEVLGLRLDGDRVAIRAATVEAVLNLLERSLVKSARDSGGDSVRTPGEPARAQDREESGGKGCLQP